jgi:hypothetical protein
MDGELEALIGDTISTPFIITIGLEIIASEKLAVIVTTSPFTKVEEAFDESDTVGASESDSIIKLKVRLSDPA